MSFECVNVRSVVTDVQRQYMNNRTFGVRSGMITMSPDDLQNLLATAMQPAMTAGIVTDSSGILSSSILYCTTGFGGRV